MNEQKYWVALGHGQTPEDPHYAQSLITEADWMEGAKRDTSCAVIIEITFDPDTGAVTATVEKNERKARTRKR